MLALILVMASTPLVFNGCTQEPTPVYVKTQGPKLETAYIPKSSAETKELNVKYKVVDKPTKAAKPTKARK